LNHRLIINTSPVGMFPNLDECPEIPYEYIGSHHILYDLIYNPEETVFLKKGKEKKAILINGLPMLIGQAERSWQVWNGPD
jgi:shikimate dehydrogenase